MHDWKAGKKDIPNNTNTTVGPIWHKRMAAAGRKARVSLRATRRMKEGGFSERGAAGGLKIG
jgi:hypothetical protein